ncbi:hypothetical protein G7046_g1425 [Stylonectria norvegica]|nr:hypothetical protein G7046_g1425 [Stylonectria norvegica]
MELIITTWTVAYQNFINAHPSASSSPSPSPINHPNHLSEWICKLSNSPAVASDATADHLSARLTTAEQRMLEQRMQKRQVKEFMGAFGGLVEHCFNSCVDDFTSKAISTKESGCLNRCVLKWMATQQRVSDRFQEHNAQLTQQMQNK